jgi:Fur family ferric uptake transcriptional regulator
MSGRRIREPGPAKPAARRRTGQRRAIGEAVDSLRGAFRVEDLLAAVKEIAPNTGRATVYRAIISMADSGLIEKVGSMEGSALYARCSSPEHHHHLVCTSCGRVEEAECGLDDMIERLRLTKGFVVTAHDLNLSGLCSKCVDRRGAA